MGFEPDGEEVAIGPGIGVDLRQALGFAAGDHSVSRGDDFEVGAGHGFVPIRGIIRIA
jgi:hypothetical protein